jgi:hypothetical protein
MNIFREKKLRGGMWAARPPLQALIGERISESCKKQGEQASRLFGD